MTDRDPEVTYAFGSVLGGPGIGRIAGHAVEGSQRAGLLDRAIAWASEDVSVPDRSLTTVPCGQYIDTLLRHYRNDVAFDLLTSQLLDSPDIFHGWNNMCLRTLDTATDRDITTVVERASSHPAVQRRLVEREYNSFGHDEGFMRGRQFDRACRELELADAVFVPSEFVLESFREEGFNDSKLHLIPFGVDLNTFRPPEGGRDGKECTVLFVGRLSLRKGIQYLLPAWDRANVDGELRLIGRVDESAKAVVEPYRDRNDIRFLGWVDDPVAEYKQSDVFVFPSVEEGSALVTYEAMAAGLPSVVTPNSGSLVEHGVHGQVVEPRNVEATAAAVKELAAKPDRRRELGRRARLTVEDYTWTAYGDRVADAYRDLTRCTR
jgi:glycosyltransferase involved in cell wall biosynthesis